MLVFAKYLMQQLVQSVLFLGRSEGVVTLLNSKLIYIIYI